MNPFPDTIIVPTTANRLRVTEENEAFIQKLLGLEVDAASFLMPENELSAKNDSKIARDNLMGQLAKLPPEIHDQIFPKPTPLPEIAHVPPTPITATEDDDDGGMGGMGMSMSPGMSRDERERLRRRESDGYGMSM
jgi:hypothetical protein